jgi:hypothetical protein
MILIFILGLVALRILYSVGEVYYERDWPRDTWKGLLIALGVLCIAVSAFGQAARVDIPLQTSGPNVPISGGPLPQALWVANAAAYLCTHPSATLVACQAAPITTYTDSTEGTTCPTATPLVQLPGNTCTASTGTAANVGFWYGGGVFDYWIVSSYGTYGPFSGNSSNSTSSGVSGMTQYGLPVAASATTITSSVQPSVWTTGHTFVPVWQPSGSALAPTTVDANTLAVSSASTATTATNVATTTESGNTNYYLTFVPANSSSNQAVSVGPMTYNPSTGNLTPTLINGLPLFYSIHGDAVGLDALSSATPGASANVALGDFAMNGTTSGAGNTAVGNGALNALTTGSNNVAVGDNAGYPGTNTTNSNSVFVGANAQASATATTNETVVGYSAVGNGSNTVTLGNTSVKAVYMGTTPLLNSGANGALPGLTLTGIAAVSGTPTGSPSGSGGTVGAGSNYAVIYSVDAAGNANYRSTESAVVTTGGSTSSIAWAWTAVTNAASYQIWVGSSSGYSESNYFTSATNSYTQTLPIASGTSGTQNQLISHSGTVTANNVIIGPATSGQTSDLFDVFNNLGGTNEFRVTYNGVVTAAGSISAPSVSAGSNGVSSTSAITINQTGTPSAGFVNNNTTAGTSSTCSAPAPNTLNGKGWHSSASTTYTVSDTVTCAGGTDGAITETIAMSGLSGTYTHAITGNQTISGSQAAGSYLVGSNTVIHSAVTGYNGNTSGVKIPLAIAWSAVQGQVPSEDSGGNLTASDLWLPEKIVPANCNNATAGNGMSLPTSNAPTPFCRTGTYVQTGYLQFTGGTTSQSAQFQTEVPGDIDTAAIPYVRVNFTQGTDTTSGHVIALQVQAICSATTDDTAWPTATAFPTETPTSGGAVNDQYTKTVQLTSANFPAACTAGNIINFNISTVTTTNTNTTVNLQMVTVTWPHKTPGVSEAN